MTKVKLRPADWLFSKNDAQNTRSTIIKSWRIQGHTLTWSIVRVTPSWFWSNYKVTYLETVKQSLKNIQFSKFSGLIRVDLRLTQQWRCVCILFQVSEIAFVIFIFCYYFWYFISKTGKHTYLRLFGIR